MEWVALVHHSSSALKKTMLLVVERSTRVSIHCIIPEESPRLRRAPLCHKTAQQSSDLIVPGKLNASQCQSVCYVCFLLQQNLPEQTLQVGTVGNIPWVKLLEEVQIPSMINPLCWWNCNRSLSDLLFFCCWCCLVTCVFELAQVFKCVFILGWPCVVDGTLKSN